MSIKTPAFAKNRNPLSPFFFSGFNGLPVGGNLPSFPYSNPLLAMGNPLLNPLMMNPNTAALASFANAAAANTPHGGPAAALSSLAAASSAITTNNASVARQSPAVQMSHSPKVRFTDAIFRIQSPNVPRDSKRSLTS